VENIQLTQSFQLEPTHNHYLSNLCGEHDQHLNQIEQRLKVTIAHRGHQFQITGLAPVIKITQVLIENLFALTEYEQITPEHIHLAMQDSSLDQWLKNTPDEATEATQVTIKTKRIVAAYEAYEQKTHTR
jgi:phosphate starvation-inducible PhoH-like protein